MKKRILNHLPEIILGIIILGAAIYIAFITPSSLINWYNNDDGFFYFKVAQNIVAGNGVTFDGINPTNGFHPLWMLICLPIFAIRGDLLIPLRIVVLLFGVFQLITAIILLKVISQRVNHWLGLLLTISFVFSWTVFNNTFTGGLESALSMLMTVLTWKLAIQYHSGKNQSARLLVWVGVAAALTILSRLDNFILIGFLGIWLVFDRREDSSFLLLDMFVPVILVVVVSIQRIGYNLSPIQLFIYLLAGVLILFGTASLYLFGFYSVQPLRIPISNWYLRGAAAGTLSAVLAGGLIYILGRQGLFFLFPRSILLISTVGWILYVALIRTWLARRVFGTNEQGYIPRKMLLSEIGNWIKKPVMFLLPVIGLVGAYMVWSQINFHTVMPVSGQIKQWWGTLEVTTYGSPIHSLAGVQHYLFSHDSPFDILYKIMTALTSPFKMNQFPESTASWLMLLGGYLVLFVYEQRKAVAAWWDRLALLPILLATVYRVLYFYVSGYVHMRSWYWTVETFMIFLLILVIFLDWYEMYPESKGIRGIIFAITSIAAIFIIYTTARNIYITYPPLRSRVDPETYLVIPRMVESFTPSGAVIGTPGGGTLAYFVQDRRIMNLDGLMNSKEYFDALKQRNTHPILKRMKMEYVFANQYAILESPPYNEIFDGCLTPLYQVFGKMLFSYTCN